MLAIANQRMNVSVGDAEVGALLVGTGEALGVHALGGSPAAFHLTPGTYRRRRWPSTRRGSGGETTGGAIVWERGLSRRWSVVRLASPFEEESPKWKPVKTPEPRQREEKADQEQELVHMKCHNDPRC